MVEGREEGSDHLERIARPAAAPPGCSARGRRRSPGRPTPLRPPLAAAAPGLRTDQARSRRGHLSARAQKVRPAISLEVRGVSRAVASVRCRGAGHILRRPCQRRQAELTLRHAAVPRPPGCCPGRSAPCRCVAGCSGAPCPECPVWDNRRDASYACCRHRPLLPHGVDIFTHHRWIDHARATTSPTTRCPTYGAMPPAADWQRWPTPNAARRRVRACLATGAAWTAGSEAAMRRPSRPASEACPSASDCAACGRRPGPVTRHGETAPRSRSRPAQRAIGEWPVSSTTAVLAVFCHDAAGLDEA